MLHIALDQNHITFFPSFFLGGWEGGVMGRVGKEKRPGPCSFFFTCSFCSTFLQVTEELLWELFVQAGPVGKFQTSVIPKFLINENL